MVYIPFPRISLDGNNDLTTWRGKMVKNEGDWTFLKPFLSLQPRHVKGQDAIPKCWYTELPQGDHYALDVEHFRPKKDARPLNITQIKAIEKQLGYKIAQSSLTGAYPWLEFDYRNYRLVTATPNRGGAKHMYFPIVENSNRLTNPQNPWQTNEYNLLLDPTNRHDAKQLIVLSNGRIEPAAPKVTLTAADFANYAALWQSDGFNYLRATVTIYIYRLQEKIFQEGREEVYAATTKLLDRLSYYFEVGLRKDLMDPLIEDIFLLCLPSAKFSLAARSALKAHVPPTTKPVIAQAVMETIKTISTRIENLNNEPISWNNP